MCALYDGKRICSMGTSNNYPSLLYALIDSFVLSLLTIKKIKKTNEKDVKKYEWLNLHIKNRTI